MKQNNITIFNNDVFGEVRAILVDEETYFVGKDVATALGYKNPSEALNKHVDEEDKVQIPKRDLQNCEDIGTKGATLINESGIYSLIFGSKLESAKAFKRWVTSEILPTLRRSGVVVLEHAEEEAIDYQAKYGRYRIRKTFTESKDLRAEYEQYAALSKLERDAKRIDNKERIKNCKTIISVLEEKVANEVLTLKPSELLAIQELICDIQADITVLHNRLNGGKKSAMTKKIAKLEQELSVTQENEEYYFIDSHPFSENYMYSYLDNKIVKSAPYHRWINKLHLEKYLPQEYPGVDFTQPIRITLLYGHKEGMDTQNFGKSIIDQVAKFYNFNDSLVHECTQSLYGYVGSYNEGYIYLLIENI